MSRAVKVQGIECPIIREGDNIVNIVTESVLNEVEEEYIDRIYSGREQAILGIVDEPELVDEDGDTYVPYKRLGYNLQDKSIIGITESVVARAAGQYITVDDIAADIEKKFGKDATIALINPIYSRNRFSLILRGIARSAKKVIIIMPEYDEVGNPRGVNPFTGVNIEEYYKELCESENCECYFHTLRAWTTIEIYCNYNKCINYIYCGLHNYDSFILEDGSICNYYTLKDICSDKSPDWGVLGTNKATEEKLKLFPSKAEAQRVCDEVKAKIKEKTGKDVIVCVYGDGCFKDPVGGIWEFADPITMPAHTDKELIESSPHEIKLKSLIDSNDKKDFVSDEDLKSFANSCKSETSDRKNNESSMGTTPRIYRDLLASLMDLTSGSGDRATPVVLVQNYF